MVIKYFRIDVIIDQVLGKLSELRAVYLTGDLVSG